MKVLKMDWRILLVAGGMVFCIGCGGPIYNNGRSQSSVISSRAIWRASGDLRSPASAIDGDVNTVASSTAPDGRGTLTIDLGKPCVFNMVIIEHGPNEYGFARRVVLLTSTDGQSFTQRYAAAGTRRVTILCPSTPILARYVRLQAMVPGSQPWSVAEVYLQ